MKPIFAAAALSVFSLSACSGIGDAMQYSGIKPVAFAHNGKTWRVFDKPEEGRLMITPTIADSAAAGTIQGATLGIAGDPITGRDTIHTGSKFEDAAGAWVKRHGDDCKLTSGKLLISPQWEFQYSCG